MLFHAFIASVLATAPSQGPELVHVQHFTLDTPYTYNWTAERPRITQGTIVVVQVDEADARVRQVGGPVLYVGTTPAERTNNGDKDGRIVAFVPGHQDLTTVPVYWGPSTLPERVGAVHGANALSNARAVPHSPSQVREVAAEPMTFSDATHLYTHLTGLVAEHAPSDGRPPTQSGESHRP